MWVSASNPVFTAPTPTSTTPIQIDVTWDDGITEAFWADPADELSPYAADLHSRAYAGEFGTVAAYVAGTSLTPPVGWSTALESMEGEAYRSLHTGDTGEYLTGRWWKAPAEDGGFDAGLTFNYDFPSGWYTITGTWSNGPAGTAAVAGVLHVIQRDSSTVRQTQVLYTASGIWWRYGSGSLGAYTWGGWYKVAVIGGVDDITTTGAVVAGATAARSDMGYGAKLQVHGTSSAATISAVGWRNSSGGGTVALGKSRSLVPGTPVIVQTGDVLGDLAFHGDDGANLLTRAALLRVTVSGTPAAGVIPAAAALYTNNAAGTSTKRMEWKVDGTVEVPGGFSAAGGIAVGGGSTLAKILTATASLNFPSIAAGSSQDLTITVTGAAVNDSVSLGPPSAPTAGLVYTAFVSAANTVTVRATNITGAAIDPGALTFRATVFSF